MGACAPEGERERFCVVGKATRPKSFRWSTGRLRWLSKSDRASHQDMKADTSSPRTRARGREVALAQRFTRGGVSGAKARAFKHEGGEGDSSGHPRRIRCHIPLASASHVKAASSIAWSKGCGASEQNAVELAAIPQVIRSKARRLKRHAPAHGIAGQYGEPSRNMRHDFAESKERLRLKVQVERLATRDIANRRASALPMPRKLETETLSTRTCKQPHRIIPSGNLLREAVNKHDRGR